MKPSIPASSARVIDVTEESFERDVLEVSDATPVVVDFWSPSCQPCRILGPLLERLVNEREGRVVLAKVNTDQAPRLAAYFGISAIPAIKVIYQRQLVNEFEGLIPEAALRQFLDDLAPMADPAMQGARAAEESAPAEAEARYRDLVAKEPDNLDARVGLARVLLAEGKLEEIAGLLEPVGSSGDLGTEADRLLARGELVRAGRGLPDEAELRRRIAADPKDAAARLDLGKVLASRAGYEEALAALLEAAELDLKLATGPAREAMVQIFYALGSSHPLSNDYRSKLSRLLY